MNTPQPRPALRRADDASVHPALSIAPSQVPPSALAGRSTEPSDGGRRDKTAPKPKKSRKPADQPYRGAGKATSDVWRGRADKDKPVKMAVTVPKSLRKQLRATAKASGTSMDKLVAEILTTWVGDPRRW